MNILTSYNWLKEYLDTDLSPGEFAAATTNAGNSVERTKNIGEGLEGVVVGEIKSIDKHPDANKLSVAKVDVGKKDNLQIIFGQMVEMEVGFKIPVAVAPMTMPNGNEIKKTKLRGEVSEGMLCLDQELGFSDKGVSIRFFDESVKNGTSIVDALELDDVIFDIEVTSNRPDCRSIIGQAREGGAAIGGGFKMPQVSIPKAKETPSFSIQVDEPELCPKYSAISIENVKVGPSPWWMQKKLMFAGFKPINNIVDITNYVLHEYGQPLHTFDADKLEGEKIIVRKAKKNEKFLALDENEYKLSSDQLVIADEKQAVAVAGVMGGELTGTTENTTRVLIESATFDPVSVRQTSRALNLYSDSQLLFEKGLSTESTKPALARAVELILELAGGEVASGVLVEEAKTYEPLVFDFNPTKVNELMGVELKEEEMASILKQLGFQVTPPNPPLKRGGTYKVVVPYWRDRDIEDPVDFTEEIARIYGYEKIPPILPQGDLSEQIPDSSLFWRRRIKQILAGAGLTEAYSYSFVSEKQIELFDCSQVMKLKNPLNSEQEYLRQSLLPSMLTTVAANQKRFSEAELFETAPVYKAQKNDKPKQIQKLVIAVYGKDGVESFSHVKGMLERLFRQTGITDWSYSRDDFRDHLHTGRQARVFVGKEDVGWIGQVNNELSQAFDLDVDVVVAGLNIDLLIPMFSVNKSYTPLPQFPSVKRDLAFVVDESVEYKTVVDVIEKESALVGNVGLFDVYRGKGIENGKKSIAIHMDFLAQDRTLESEEVDVELEKIRTVLQKKFSAIMRS